MILSPVLVELLTCMLWVPEISPEFVISKLLKSLFDPISIALFLTMISPEFVIVPPVFMSPSAFGT